MICADCVRVFQFEFLLALLAGVVGAICQRSIEMRACFCFLALRTQSSLESHNKNQVNPDKDQCKLLHNGTPKLKVSCIVAGTLDLAPAFVFLAKSSYHHRKVSKSKFWRAWSLPRFMFELWTPCLAITISLFFLLIKHCATPILASLGPSSAFSKFGRRDWFPN